jgi:signal transduction histidine kinase
MAELMQQLVNLLLNPPGNLIYHLVLAFSIAAVLPSAINQRRNSNFPQGNRMVVGLSLLLTIRLLLFLAPIIALWGGIEERLLLPPIDRAVTTISLVLLLWLWCFPKPQRLADILTIVFGILIVALSVVCLIWWWKVPGNSPGFSFNSFATSTIFDAVALCILAAGSLTAIVRRPSGWGFGLVMFVFLAIGHALSIAFPSPGSDYSGAVRLTQMIAYPLLFALPQRFISGDSRLPLPPLPQAIEDHRHLGIDFHFLESLLTLGVETEAFKLCQATTLAIAHTMLADFCILTSPSEDDQDILFESGYDLIREDHFPDFSLKANKLPAMVEAIQQNQTLLIPASSNSPDLTNLAKSLNLANTGPLLAAPVLNKAGELLCMLVLLTPYSGREWSEEDRSTLVLIAHSLAQILQRNLSAAPYLQEIEALQKELQASRSEAEAANLEVGRLSSRINSSSGVLNKGIGESVESEPGDQSAPQGPQEASKMQEILANEMPGGVNEKLEGEWLLALEEIDRLNKIILEMEQAQREYLSHPGMQINSGSKSEMYSNITQELSSPLSSINGYTDFLLAESFGSLGPIQRKFVERIKFSCDRINNILEVTPDSNITLAEKMQLHLEAIDLQKVIDNAVDRIRFAMMEKKITLDRTRSQYLPTAFADRDALEQVLISLLENAIAVTPEEGKISLRTQKKEINGDQQKVLILVSDQGGSRTVKTTYQVFTSQPDSSILNVNQEGIDMAMLKDLVEMQNGSIWIESEEGLGSTVNLLMPISSTLPPSEPVEKESQSNSDEEIQPYNNGGIQE